MEEYVTLVDADDRAIGTEDKLIAHREPMLHRACSVVLFNSRSDMLLQRRSAGKYHSAGLWSNTCCTHPRPGEQPIAAALRRLYEEMGMTCELRFLFSFIYHARLDNGLVEFELDHVFGGVSDDDPDPDPSEVGAWRWGHVSEVARDFVERPYGYTKWFPLIMQRLQTERPSWLGVDDKLSPSMTRAVLSMSRPGSNESAPNPAAAPRPPRERSARAR